MSIKLIRDKDIIYNDKEYMEIVEDILLNDTVQDMKNYRQHYNVSCFDHCLYASYNMYIICKKRNLDYKSAARGAMVHDLFLYDWRKKQEGRKGWHAFTHPKTSYENACKFMDINEKEKDIILKHMWPVTFFHFPKYKESFLLTIIDKYLAVTDKNK